MGAYCSVHNDTDELMYIKYGPNMSALQWAGVAAGIAAAIATAGAAVAVGLGVANIALDNELKNHGYSAIRPGGTYTSDKLSLSLFLQANIVLKRGDRVRCGTLDCWTGSTDNSCNHYEASQASY